ncbi:MAG: hypothetical protein E7290_03580 [Lachnospiraceae bacterium]|nr:hypothetical protein [Lachnospiraceae bacterium]
MLLNVIMAVGIYPVFVIMYVILRKNAKPQKGRYFSVTFKNEWLEDEETKKTLEEVNKAYDGGLLRAFIISMAVPALCFVIPYVSIQCTIWCVWIFAAIAIFYIPFFKANARLRKYKEEKGWNVQAEREIHVELKSLGQIRCVSLSRFIVPFAVTLLTGASGIVYRASGKVWGDSPANEMCFYVFYITCLLCMILFAVCAIAMDKKNTDVISKDSDVNLNYTRAKKNIWKSFWQQAAWLTAVMQILISVALWYGEFFMSFVLWGTVSYSIVLIVVCLRISGRLSAIDKSYADKKDVDLCVDDDRYWIGGIIYYNPNDKRSMVETRIGMGTTTNMARPLGWILDIIGIASIVLCIGMCAWVVLEEFTPISLSIGMVTDENLAPVDECIKAEHMKTEYEILASDIVEISYLEELPKMSKTNGSAMDKMYKGKFFVSEEERKCYVFLNPQNTIFLKIKTNDGIYYMSGIDDAQTQLVYDFVMRFRKEGE